MSQISNNFTGVPQLGTGNASAQPAAAAGNSAADAGQATGVSPNGAPSQGTQQQGQTKAVHQQHAVNQAVVQINDYMQFQNRSLEFSIDKSTGRAVVKVIDQASGKVLQQIPPEYAIKLAETLHSEGQVSSIGVMFTT